MHRGRSRSLPPTSTLVERRRLVREEDFSPRSRRGQHGQAHFQIPFAPAFTVGRLMTVDHGLIQLADHRIPPCFIRGERNLLFRLLTVDEEAVRRLPNVALLATHQGQPVEGRMRRGP
jgi:hypothetical protein